MNKQKINYLSLMSSLTAVVTTVLATHLKYNVKIFLLLQTELASQPWSVLN